MMGLDEGAAVGNGGNPRQRLVERLLNTMGSTEAQGAPPPTSGKLAVNWLDPLWWSMRNPLAG